MVKKVLVKTISRWAALVYERGLGRVEALIAASLPMLAAVLRTLVDRPGFIIAPILAATFNLD